MLSGNCLRMWVLLPEQWPGDVVGLEMQCVYVGGEIRAARQQRSKLVATMLGVATFILAMPDTSRETTCVGYAQEPKIALLLWVTSKRDPPALFEGICKPFNPGDGLLCREAISLSPIYISQSGLTCTMSQIALPPHPLTSLRPSLNWPWPWGTKGALPPNPSPIQVVSPQHRHNCGSARETWARAKVHCLLLSFSCPQDLICSTLALQELSVASRLSSSVGTCFCHDFISSEVDSQKARGHISLTGGRASWGGIQLCSYQSVASLDIRKYVSGYEHPYLHTPSYSVLEPLWKSSCRPTEKSTSLSSLCRWSHFWCAPYLILAGSHTPVLYCSCLLPGQGR